jgi:uncharacterized protein
VDENRHDMRPVNKRGLDALRRHLRELLPELRRRYHVVDIAVFGSRVGADAGPRSDLDLLVTFDDEASLFDLIALEQDLGERLGVEVDVVTPASIKPRLRKRILESAVPV